MDVREFLNNQAQANSWRFIHARRDYQNLTDVLHFFQDEIESFEDNESGIFLDPVSTSREADGIRYTGSFMLLTRSDLDMSYEQKYLTFIKPALNIINGSMWNSLRCNFDVSNWTAIEVINVFDFNADGISCQFNLKSY